MLSPDKLVLLIIKFFHGYIRGKTLLQKRAYFIARLLGFDDYGFDAHYYGPYSQSIEQGLSKVKTLNFVRETLTDYGFDVRTGFEIVRYDYALTEDGEKILAHLEQCAKNEYGQVYDICKKLADAGDCDDYYSLSIAAKIHHILYKQKEAMGSDEIRAFAKKLNWEIKEGDLDNAVNFLKKLELIEDVK